MTQDQCITRVVFRKWTNGDIIALFPDILSDYDYICNCLSYEHIGQHGAASVTLTQVTKKASPAEYADLQKELETIGYSLKIMQRIPSNAIRNRETEWKKTRSGYNTQTKTEKGL